MKNNQTKGRREAFRLIAFIRNFNVPISVYRFYFRFPCNGKIYYSIDKGILWDSVTLDHAFPVRQIVRNSKGEYFATTGMMNIEEGFIGNGVMYNDGSLMMWHKRNNGLSPRDLFCDYIAIDKNDRLYLATANEYGKDNSGLFMSDDGGITWQHKHCEPHCHQW
jgi:hypothetical protein